MYAFTLSVEIEAPPARVWRALCDPEEVVRWDTGIAGALDAPPDYPQPGQHVRWRYTAGPFRILHDRPLEVLPDRTLRSLLAVGPLRFYETYTLEPADGGCHLTVSMSVRTPLPLAGPAVDALYIGPRTRRNVAASVRALKHHCERSP